MAEVTQESLNAALVQLNEVLSTLLSKLAAANGNEARLVALENAVGILTNDHAQMSQEIDRRIGSLEVATSAVLTSQVADALKP